MSEDFTYASVCSGIEAATVAFEPLGWKPVWFSEIAPFPCKVLKYHYPDVPNLGDMTKLTDHELFRSTNFDLLIGGTPCQSFSIAGLRRGLDSANGNIALEYCRILIAKRPTWFIWENVPGIFSSFTDEAESKVSFGSGEYDCSQTADFATLLTAFRECGYCCAWRVLDSQHFGVPQRRRRVFVVGYLGDDWRPPFAVLFERESLRRNLTPRRKKREEAAKTSIRGIEAFGGNNTSGSITGPSWMDFESDTFLIFNHQASVTEPMNPAEVSPSLDKSKTPAVLYSIIPQNSGKDYKAREVEVTQPLMAGGPYGGNQGGDYIIFDVTQITSKENRSNPQNSDPCHPLAKNQHAPVLVNNEMIRRLTPLECERLQGFPDGYTDIPSAKDSPRYQAIGNSMTIQVVRWIGSRIKMVHSVLTA